MTSIKEGDWVRVNHEGIINPRKVIYIQGSIIGTFYWEEQRKSEFLVEDVSLWKPKQGEWCWHIKSGSLVKCMEYTSEFKFTGYYLHGSDFSGLAEDCEPFIGNLPEFLK